MLFLIQVSHWHLPSFWIVCLAFSYSTHIDGKQTPMNCFVITSSAPGPQYMSGVQLTHPSQALSVYVTSKKDISTITDSFLSQY